MSRHVAETVTLRTFALEVIGPPFSGRDVHYIVKLAQIVNTALDEAEENLTDLLPEGYSVRIREWDEEETPNE